MKVALVHDWINGLRGGERVLEALCELYPQADLYTLIYEPGTSSKTIENLPIYSTILGKLPKGKSHYRHYLPLMPLLIKQFNLSSYDLVISSSHCVAKGVRTGDTLHICYLHSPMRYMWDLFNHYFSKEQAGLLTRTGAQLFRPYLKWWDRYSNRAVDHFIANSAFVQQRAKRYYNRDAVVIHPPVNIDQFYPADEKENYYLIVSALVPYKKIDFAIDAFNQLNLPLKIVGSGSELSKLKSLANKNVELLGWQDQPTTVDLFAKAKAFIFPQIEDFGITAVESQASGTPVIAFRGGGALETVIEGKTGLFFNEQSPAALIDAVRRFESINIKSEDCVLNAQRFNKNRFKKEFKNFVQKYTLTRT